MRCEESEVEFLPQLKKTQCCLCRTKGLPFSTEQCHHESPGVTFQLFVYIVVFVCVLACLCNLKT